MKRALVRLSATAVWAWITAAAAADGGFFFLDGQAPHLAQTRQEVIIAFYRAGSGSAALDKAVYVLRSRYLGAPPETLAWVIPLPATPTDVIAHPDSSLFDNLDAMTRPRFLIASGGMMPGCGCAAADVGGDGRQTGLVVVDAQGQAGVFDWAALTSTGAGALVDWLNENGYAVPATAAAVLADYIAQDMHFLAVRVREPEQIEADGEGIMIPPIQFTCQTSRRFYPLAISRISAAEETEVLIYVLADHRVEAANVANAVIRRDAARYKAGSPSLTNYEDLFAATIAQHDGLALITEYAQSWYDQAGWVTAPPAVLNLNFLTRLRTVVARERMVVDFEFRDAAEDGWVDSYFWVSDADVGGLAAMGGGPLTMLLAYAGFHVTAKRYWSPGRRGRAGAHG